METQEIQNWLKRASDLENEQEYEEALSLYNRVLENDPDNEKAKERRKILKEKNNTIKVIKEPWPMLGGGTRGYYFMLDNEKVGTPFVFNMPSEFEEKIGMGKHELKLMVHDRDKADRPLETQVLKYPFEITGDDVTVYVRFTKSKNLHFSTEAHESDAKTGGCYVATAVYGSYDCPEVWTLRRFRDYTLAETWYGRAFIHTYYAISPILVKWFGTTEWFKKLWKPTLDKMVKSLNEKGIKSTEYTDKEW